MYHPAIDDEVTTIRRSIEDQLAAIRAAAFGLSDEQVRARPVTSALSVGGIIKHCVFVLESRLAGMGRTAAAQSGATSLESRLAGMGLRDCDYEDFYASFALTEDESFSDVLAGYDQAVARYLQSYDTWDPTATLTLPPAPWFGRTEPAEATLRYQMLQDLVEFARHAGHADIIREQIDAAKALELLAAVEGLPANDFVTPWKLPD
jgi:hypothetical protein